MRIKTAIWRYLENDNFLKKSRIIDDPLMAPDIRDVIVHRFTIGSVVAPLKIFVISFSLKKEPGSKPPETPVTLPPENQE
jgi:hypothetical protein